MRLRKSIVSLYENKLVFFVCVRASPNRDLNFIYCILPTLQVEAEVPFLEEDESPPVKRHCKFFYTDFTSPIPDEFSGSFSVALFCWWNSGRKSMAGFELYEDRPEKNLKVRFCDKESFQNCSNEFVFSFFTIATTQSRIVLGDVPLLSKKLLFGRRITKRLSL